MLIRKPTTVVDKKNEKRTDPPTPLTAATTMSPPPSLIKLNVAFGYAKCEKKKDEGISKKRKK